MIPGIDTRSVNLMDLFAMRCPDLIPKFNLVCVGCASPAGAIVDAPAPDDHRVQQAEDSLNNNIFSIGLRLSA